MLVCVAVQCRPGSVAPAAGSTGCTNCSEGFTTPITSRTTCSGKAAFCPHKRVVCSTQRLRNGPRMHCSECKCGPQRLHAYIKSVHHMLLNISTQLFAKYLQGMCVTLCAVCRPGRAGRSCQKCRPGTWSPGADAASVV